MSSKFFQKSTEPDRIQVSAYDPEKAKEYRARFKARHPNYYKTYQKDRHVKKPVRHRPCKDCGVDIFDRGRAAKRCVKCAETRKLVREDSRSSLKPECMDCGKQVECPSKRPKQCVSCKKTSQINSKLKWNKEHRDEPTYCKECGVRTSQKVQCGRCRDKAKRSDQENRNSTRACKECGASIAHRKPHAKFCVTCHKIRQKAQIKAGTAKWKAENPGKEKARRATVIRNRRGRKRAGQGRISQKQWQSVLDTFEGKCAYCPEPGTTMDHIVPLVKGGAHSIENIVPACMSCNTSKGTKLLSDWKPGFSLTKKETPCQQTPTAI